MSSDREMQWELTNTNAEVEKTNERINRTNSRMEELRVCVPGILCLLFAGYCGYTASCTSHKIIFL